MSERMIEARVAVGVALLDAAKPGWEFEINIEVLDMGIGYQPAHAGAAEAGCGCILTQLYGDWITGKAELDITSFEAEEAGFEALWGTTWSTDDEYEELGDEWIDRILAKRRVANA